MAEYGLAHSEPFIWREQLTAIAASESRASHMVEQLLALAFADESRDTVRLMPVQLADLVRSVALEAWPRADARGVDLGVAGADIPVQVMGDSALIEGAMNNLIDNALRHGKPAGHAQAVITMSVREDAHTIVLQVCDNGPGMDAVSRRILMQRWQQADRPERPDNDARRGVGLGLAIVSRYADLLGAQFELADGIPCGDGKGLCAALVWPKVAASAKPAKDVAT
jgi:two-component system sensor histidine kinase TctE